MQWAEERYAEIATGWDFVRCQVDLLWIFMVLLFPAADSSQAEVSRHMEMGRQFLSGGQFADALTHYHAAIDLDPKNYQTLYSRATVYLAIGKSKAALPDLDLVIKLKPDFTAARIERGNVLLKQGDINQAKADFEAAAKVDPSNADVSKKLASVEKVKQIIEEADDYFDAGDFVSAEQLYSSAIEVCQWHADLYRNRAKCREKRDDVQKAIADYRTVTKLLPDSTETFYKISQLYYLTGDVEESLNQIRECLKLNPDDELCFPFYKKIKKLAKMRESLNLLVREKRWMDCLDKAILILKAEKKVENIQLDVYRQTCKCNLHAGHFAESISACSEVLKHDDPNDIDVLCDRAEAFLMYEKYDEAIEDYQKALNRQEESKRAREGLHRAQKLKKQIGKRDYYKILGIRKNANKRDILKAYRKKAQEWHPDNFSDENEKKRAEKKFVDIADAKEVLTDPEKRALYDNGEDPLDPEQQQGGFHHPFQGGFPFGENGAYMVLEHRYFSIARGLKLASFMVIPRFPLTHEESRSPFFKEEVLHKANL
uniref:J domain-containing protein n=1 Tax=Setaria digitata TaxID=48799 RepID=A0A915Q3Z7_9BILA